MNTSWVNLTLTVPQGCVSTIAIRIYQEVEIEFRINKDSLSYYAIIYAFDLI